MIATSNNNKKQILQRKRFLMLVRPCKYFWANTLRIAVPHVKKEEGDMTLCIQLCLLFLSQEMLLLFVLHNFSVFIMLYILCLPKFNVLSILTKYEHINMQICILN